MLHSSTFFASSHVLVPASFFYYLLSLSTGSIIHGRYLNLVSTFEKACKTPHRSSRGIFKEQKTNKKSEKNEKTKRNLVLNNKKINRQKMRK